MSMKGLTQFIIDIRNSQDSELERKRINYELNNIQTKFNSSGLNGYQSRKYICKLIYIYLLGYNHELIDFGLNQGLKLVNSNVLIDKQTGYLSMSIFINNDRNNNFEYFKRLMTVLYPSLMQDLRSRNDDFNILAMEFICNNFNVDLSDKLKQYSLPFPPKLLLLLDQLDDLDSCYEQLTRLTEEIVSIAISPVNEVMLKKKAINCVKVLLNLHPQILLENSNWIPRLLNLLDNSNDLSVILNSVSLVELIVRLNPKLSGTVIPSITTNLYNILIKKECDEIFYYYNNPSPWLVIKLLKLLEICFLINKNLIFQIDDHNLNSLRVIISSSISNASKLIQGLPNRNIQSAILFQSVSLAIFLHASNDSIKGAIKALVSLLTSNDTNTRFLSLDVLIKLIGRSNLDSNATNSSSIINSGSDYVQLLLDDLSVILRLLNDKDIGIKHKTLDLLYIITNDHNYQLIIKHLIDYYPFCEFQLRLELSIKIAILLEKFTKDSIWYINIMIKLLSFPSSGNTGSHSDYFNNEIWERIIQIIINNENLHVTTTRLILSKVKALVDNNEVVPENLVKITSILISEFSSVDAIKKDFSPGQQFNILYQNYLKVTSTTRGMLLTTFLKLLNMYPEEEFVPNILDLFEIESTSIDLEIQTRACEYLKMFTLNDNHKLFGNILKPLPPFESKSNHLLSRLGNITSIVGDSHLVTSKKIKRPPTSKDFVNESDPDATKSSSGISDSDAESDEGNPFDEEMKLSANWYNGYHRMLHFDAGVFYETQLIKITYRLEKVENFKLIYRFIIINNSYKTTRNLLTNFKISNLYDLNNSKSANYLIDINTIPEQVIETKTSLELSIKVRNIVEPHESPYLILNFNCGGSFNKVTLKFPINILKTLTATSLSLDDFKSRWLQINQLLPNNQGEHLIRSITNYRYTLSNIGRLLQRLNFYIVHSTSDDDTNGILILAAGILHTQANNFGVLLSIKSIDNIGKNFEIIVKCTGGGVSEIVAVILNEIFEGKF